MVLCYNLPYQMVVLQRAVPNGTVLQRAVPNGTVLQRAVPNGTVLQRAVPNAIVGRYYFVQKEVETHSIIFLIISYSSALNLRCIEYRSYVLYEV
jgi:hypothetical protein